MTHPSSPPAPMTAERLEEIREIVLQRDAAATETERRLGYPGQRESHMLAHIDALTARVATLESELAAARKDARRDALEEAASECLILERDDAIDCPSGPTWKWYGKSRDHAAARIRALQTKDTTP